MFGAITDRLIATIISIGSLFFPFIEGIEPGFADIILNPIGNNLVLSMRLENCYNDELDKILTSGQKITLRFQAELIDRTKKTPVKKRSFYHTVSYNPLEKTFYHFSSESNLNNVLESLNGAHTEFATVHEAVLFAYNDLKRDTKYSVRLSAQLDPITFIGEKKDFDLMLFWNNKRPSVDTETFDTSIFFY